MKRLKNNLLLSILLTIGIVTISCENENLQEEINLELTTNFELIKENLKIYQESKNDKSFILPIYACSEEGGPYVSKTYVTHGVYLNELYVPFLAPSNSNRYTSWQSNLQSWLMNNFNDTNPGGSNSVNVFFEFDVYGADGGTYLNATDGDRAYNEFVCRLMDQLSVSSVNDLKNYEFSLNIIVDYYLCCTGSCCEPIMAVNGVAYY